MSLPDPEVQPEFYHDVPLKRALAWLIDLLITLVLTILALPFTLFVAAFFLPLFYVMISIAYRTVMLSRYGATFGMMLTALKWRRLNGTAPDPLTAFYYSAIHAGQWAVIPVQIASVVMILVTPYRQGLNDQIMGTTMLHRFAPE